MAETDGSGEAEVQVADPAPDAAADTAKEPVAAEKAAEKVAEKPAEKPAEADWRASIQDQKLRDHAGRFTSAQDLAKAHLDLRSELSKRPPAKPGKDAKPEDWATYHKAIGVPDAYEWTRPEGRDFTEEETARQQEVAQRLKEANFTADQQRLIDSLWTEVQADAAGQFQKQQQKLAEEAEAALHKEWGPDFDANARIAVAAWTQYGGSEALENLRLEGGGRLGDHPLMMKMFAKIGREVMESPGAVGMPADERQSLEERRRDLVAQSIDANQRGDRQKAQRLRREAMELAEKIHGTAPADRAA